MIDALVVFPADAEADDRPDVVHDAVNVGAKFSGGHVHTDGFVAAGDVVTDAGRADGVFVGDDPADGDGVAFVVVGHERDFVGGEGAGFDLGDGTGLGRAPDGNVVYELHGLLPCEFRQLTLHRFIGEGINLGELRISKVFFRG